MTFHDFLKRLEESEAAEAASLDAENNTTSLPEKESVRTSNISTSEKCCVDAPLSSTTLKTASTRDGGTVSAHGDVTVGRESIDQEHVTVTVDNDDITPCGGAAQSGHSRHPSTPSSTSTEDTRPSTTAASATQWRPCSRVYLQQGLFLGIGDRLTADFQRVKWDWINAMKKVLDFGPLTTNLLLIGQKGTITPCHYDEQHNFLAQMQGQKRVVLFSPNDFEYLYPYPADHPADRQSQVDMYAPDYERFPKLHLAQGWEAVLEPGDVLYIPVYWWHHIDNPVNRSMAINFWYKSKPAAVPPEQSLPLRTAPQKMALRRNIEKLATLELTAPVAAHFWKAAAGEEAMTPAFEAYRSTVIERLHLVLSPEDITGGFFEGLNAARFSVPLVDVKDE